MQKACRLVLALTLFGALAGCQYFKFPGVHKIEIQQGNIITQDMIDQLKPGMTRRQVRYVMGTPLLEDTFTPNRWDYYYSKKDSDGELSRERISIYFNGDILSHFSGDFAPSAAKAAPAADTATAETEETEETEE